MGADPRWSRAGGGSAPPGAGESLVASGERQRSLEHWLVLAAALGGLVLLAGAGLLLEPDPRGYGTHERLGLEPCLPMELWRVPCPGCGVTTALVHAARGDLRASLVVQPFGLLLALGAVAFAGWSLWLHLRRRDLWARLERLAWPRWMAAAGTLLLLGWIYKIAVS